MSNFDRLNSSNDHILDRLISKSEAIPQNPSYVYGGRYLGAPFPLKIFALKYSAFSVNWCKYPILDG